jgi:sugar (pentulose or hexulose) kinase
MPAITLGVDLGTTTITALAWEPAAATIRAVATIANDAEVTAESDKARGRSEWDPPRIVDRACEAVRSVVERLGPRGADVAAVGITCQMHGLVLLDRQRRPILPLVNWQDRRGEEPFPGGSGSCVEQAMARIGEDAVRRTGCRLATGYSGVTLFWLKSHGLLPATGTACFIGDYFGSMLTGQGPVSDPTNAASSGVFDADGRRWDRAILEALELPPALFPEIREADRPLGPMSDAGAAATGIRQGVPVFVALGDSQAAFLGSVRNRDDDVLLNVGTGAQVAAAVDRFLYAAPLQTRPLPGRGSLLTVAQPCGGRAYAILEGFLRGVLRDCDGRQVEGRIYEVMNRLAASVPPGADGLRCQPCFAGTPADPRQRAEWTGISPANFTPAHVIRALLEGMAEIFFDDYRAICHAAGKSYGRLVGSGNGLRSNRVLRQIVAERFAMPLDLPPHEEEAAVGAARLAAIGAGVADETELNP